MARDNDLKWEGAIKAKELFGLAVVQLELRPEKWQAVHQALARLSGNPTQTQALLSDLLRRDLLLQIPGVTLANQLKEKDERVE